MKDHTTSPVEMSKEEFRRLGYQLIDSISEFNDEIEKRPVTTGESPAQISEIIGSSSLPEHGTPPEEILKRASGLLFNHSLLNGHPKFYGYITSSPAPLGAH